MKRSEFFEYHEDFESIDIDEVKEHQSLFGNYVFLLTQEDIDALTSGKILCHLDEYGIFIGMNDGKDEEIDDVDIMPSAKGCLERLEVILKTYGDCKDERR